MGTVTPLVAIIGVVWLIGMSLVALFGACCAWLGKRVDEQTAAWVAEQKSRTRNLN